MDHVTIPIGWHKICLFRIFFLSSLIFFFPYMFIHYQMTSKLWKVVMNMSIRSKYSQKFRWNLFFGPTNVRPKLYSTLCHFLVPNSKFIGRKWKLCVKIPFFPCVDINFNTSFWMALIWLTSHLHSCIEMCESHALHRSHQTHHKKWRKKSFRSLEYWNIRSVRRLFHAQIHRGKKVSRSRTPSIR